jgi:hypothetical protein
MPEDCKHEKVFKRKNHLESSPVYFLLKNTYTAVNEKQYIAFFIYCLFIEYIVSRLQQSESVPGILRCEKMCLPL